MVKFYYHKYGENEQRIGLDDFTDYNCTCKNFSLLQKQDKLCICLMFAFKHYFQDMINERLGLCQEKRKLSKGITGFTLETPPVQSAEEEPT